MILSDLYKYVLKVNFRPLPHKKNALEYIARSWEADYFGNIHQDTVESKLVLVNSGSKWGVCSWHVKCNLEAYKPSIVGSNLGAYLDHFRAQVDITLGGGLCRIKHVVRLPGCKLKEGCKLIRIGLGSD